MRAAIFDMDGLLIDSEPLWRRAERETFAGVGLTLTDDDCRRTTGLRADMVVEYWYERHPWRGPDRTAVLRRLESRVMELVRAEGRAMPGVEHVLGAVRNGGLRLAVASSSAVELIGVVIDTLGLEGVFEVVSSGADEKHGKPDPAVYLTTLRALALPAGECLAFEDSVAGVEAARAAGLFTIAVPDPEDFENPGFHAAHLKLPSLVDFDLSVVTG